MIDILNSDWLIRMLEKSSLSPDARILALFDILEDWLNAPNIREQLSASLLNSSHNNLVSYLSQQATYAGAAMPEMLANQVYFMTVATLQNALQTKSDAGFKLAKNAASALIQAQTKKAYFVPKKVAYAIAASFFGVAILSGLMLFNPEATSSANILAKSNNLPEVRPSTGVANPLETVALMAKIEQMRHGNCQLIEALQLPDNLKGIYLNIVVNGEVSTDPEEQRIALELINKTRCNYTPMLMANSKG